jgi:hypothetical protein
MRSVVSSEGVSSHLSPRERESCQVMAVSAHGAKATRDAAGAGRVPLFPDYDSRAPRRPRGGPNVRASERAVPGGPQALGGRWTK